jgi:hypothetical protein
MAMSKAASLPVGDHVLGRGEEWRKFKPIAKK